MSADVQARQDTLLSHFEKGAKPGWVKSQNSADSQGGSSQVAECRPAVHTSSERDAAMFSISLTNDILMS